MVCGEPNQAKYETYQEDSSWNNAKRFRTGWFDFKNEFRITEERTRELFKHFECERTKSRFRYLHIVVFTFRTLLPQVFPAYAPLEHIIFNARNQTIGSYVA